MLHIAVHIVHVAVHLVPIMRYIGVLRLRSRRFGLRCIRTLWMPGHAGRVQLVRFVPVLRVGLQRVDDGRKRFAERVLWFPPQQFPGAGDIENVVSVCVIDHPLLDESVMTEDFFLDPRAQFRHAFWNAHCRPFLAVDLAMNDVLYLGIAQRFGLADKYRHLALEVSAMSDSLLDRLGQIVKMQCRLRSAKHPRIQMRRHAMLIDTGNLFGEKGGVPLVVVNPRNPQEYNRNVATVLAQYLFRIGLRLRVRPGRSKRTGFVDTYARQRFGLVYKHRACIDELFDIEVLQCRNQPARPFNIDIGVQRVWLARDVEIGSQVNASCNRV